MRKNRYFKECWAIQKALYFFALTHLRINRQESIKYVLDIINRSQPTKIRKINKKLVITCEDAGVFIGDTIRWNYVQSYVFKECNLVLAVGQQTSSVFKNFHEIEAFAWNELTEQVYGIHMPKNWYDELEK